MTGDTYAITPGAGRGGGRMQSSSAFPVLQHESSDERSAVPRAARAGPSMSSPEAGVREGQPYQHSFRMTSPVAEKGRQAHLSRMRAEYALPLGICLRLRLGLNILFSGGSPVLRNRGESGDTPVDAFEKARITCVSEAVSSSAAPCMLFLPTLVPSPCFSHEVSQSQAPPTSQYFIPRVRRCNDFLGSSLSIPTNSSLQSTLPYSSTSVLESP
ncbi:hypothetical protein C2E23DRAFT_38936 [Lenzites betulinus]|nr:hypothetical protein C2E23DRAFT_38936 [Lenzites betulinus]